MPPLVSYWRRTVPGIQLLLPVVIHRAVLGWIWVPQRANEKCNWQHHPSPKDCQAETPGRSKPQTKMSFGVVRCLLWGAKEGMCEAAGVSPWVAAWGNQPEWFHFRNKPTSLVTLHHGTLPHWAPTCGISLPSSRNNGFSSMRPCLCQQQFWSFFPPNTQIIFLYLGTTVLNTNLAPTVSSWICNWHLKLLIDVLKGSLFALFYSIVSKHQE